MEKILRALEMPEDIIYDLPKITLVGDLQCVIENHRGIIAYTSNEVRIAVSIGEIGICGEMLTIRNITKDECNLDGKIKLISLER